MTDAPAPDMARILATIRKRESGGNYTARNPSSSASGAYQFIDSTWNNYGGFAHAWQAPPAVQDAKASEHVAGILARYGNNLEAVPATWYVGHYDPANLDYVPAGGNRLTVRQYVDAWLKDYGAAPSAGGGAQPVAGLPNPLNWIPNPLDWVPGGGAVTDGLDAVQGLSRFVAMLTSWETWRRVLLTVGGAALVALGLSVLGADLSGVASSAVNIVEAVK